MQSEFSDCDRCGQAVHHDELAYKPERFDRWWWFLLPSSWAGDVLDLAAADPKREGESYGGYCGWCFGPGYKAGRQDKHV